MRNKLLKWKCDEEEEVTRRRKAVSMEAWNSRVKAGKRRKMRNGNAKNRNER